MFIELWNGVSILRDQNLTQQDHDLGSNASGSWGVGAFWNSEWLQLQWQPAIQSHQIAIKELIPITLVCALWGSNRKGTIVRVKLR